MRSRIVLCLLAYVVYQVSADVDIITEPKPGEEYVLVSSGQQTPVRNFETSHKIPEKHPSQRGFRPDDVPGRVIKKVHSLKSGTRLPTEGIISIEEDKRVLLKKGHKTKVSESIEIDIPVSKIEDIKIKENVKDFDTNPKMAVDLEAMSESGKLSGTSGTTTQKPILTTDLPTMTKPFDYIPINFDNIDDINSGLLTSNLNLETAGSEQKQHSRIQIKKGPNGQDYEYEYIYYYYDEDVEAGKGKEKPASSTAAPVHNSHDGPQKSDNENQINKDTKNRNKYSSIDRSVSTTPASSTAAETQNEVLPNGRGRQRGRNITPAPVQEEIVEDRLPSSTRFPPRGRNLGSTTTYVPEVSSESTKHRGRPQIDSVADESIGQTRSRTRSHIRRPSSELVDLDSFKTNSGDASNQYKEPTRYSAESKTTTENSEPKEQAHTKEMAREAHSIPSGIRFQEILDDSKLPSDYKTTTVADHDTTEYTTMTAMEKVALDLYAYLAGENLNNEINPTVDDLPSFDGSTTLDDDTYTTEALSTTDEPTTTTTSTTTTTTTTTPAPTTTTSAPSTRPSRFNNRHGARGRASSTTSTTDAPQESSTKARGRFSRPSLGGRRTTAAATSVSSSNSDSSTAAASIERSTSAPKQAFGRRGLFAGRTRSSTSTTAVPQGDSSAAPAESHAPKIHRPLLRRLTTSTAAPLTSSADTSSSNDASADATTIETTTAPARIVNRRPGIRPLRPGPRLNLRLDSRATSAAPAAAPADAADTSAPEAQSSAAEPSPTAAPEAPQRGVRLRPLSPSPKPRVTVTQPPRRPNPLLRRKLVTTEATTEAKTSVEEETEASETVERSVTETEPVPADTTPAPPLRGLDALYARRRAAQAGRTARPAKRNA